MKNPYDVHIEFVREEIITVEADNADEATAKALEWAEEQAEWDNDDIRVTSINVNMEY
jgi:hypothetical protein